MPETADPALQDNSVLIQVTRTISLDFALSLTDQFVSETLGLVVEEIQWTYSPL